MSVCLYVYVSWGLLDMWGELASHKKSLTHQPSCQGWACLFAGSWLGGLPFLFSYISVLSTCISMYGIHPRPGYQPHSGRQPRLRILYLHLPLRQTALCQLLYTLQKSLHLVFHMFVIIYATRSSATVNKLHVNMCIIWVLPSHSHAFLGREKACA